MKILRNIYRPTQDLKLWRYGRKNEKKEAFSVDQNIQKCLKAKILE